MCVCVCVCVSLCVRECVCMCMWYGVTCWMLLKYVTGMRWQPLCKFIDHLSKVRNTFQYPLSKRVTKQKKDVSNPLIKTALRLSSAKIPGVPTCVKKGVAHDRSRDPKMTLFNGNQGHFTNFYPYFAVNQGNSSVKIPPPPIIRPTLSREFFSILYPILREVKDKIFREKNFSL